MYIYYINIAHALPGFVWLVFSCNFSGLYIASAQYTHTTVILWERFALKDSLAIALWYPG